MVDALVMTRLHGVQELDEDTLDKSVVPRKDMPLYDCTVQIATRAIVQYKVESRLVFEDVVKGEHIRMTRRDLMRDDLPDQR